METAKSICYDPDYKDSYWTYLVAGSQVGGGSVELQVSHDQNSI